MPDNSLDDKQIQRVAENSIRQFYPGSWGGILGDGMGFLYPSAMDILPGWGTPDCDRALRILHYTQQNALWSGALNIWKQKFLSTPYEISGGRNLTYDWQDIFFASDFGEGYDFMMDKALTDYATLNRGMFIEKVGYGSPDTPLKDGARILGLNHLDALRIVITGNREYPYIYFSEYTGEMHRLHYSRVIHIAQSPSPDTFLFGMGKSMLYDALTVANAQILLGRMQNELLSDMPPPGLVIFNNIKGEQVVQALTQFEADRNRDGQSVYRAPLHLESMNPAEPATVTFVPLAQVPSDFDYEKYMRNHVNLLALTMGLDPQDIWPLSSQVLGSGAQSKILQSKTQGKGPGYLLTRCERVWNTVIPRSLQWKYKPSNAQEGREQAEIAKMWTDVINSATFMADDEKRQMAANQIQAFADVLFDESGDLIRLDDVDPKEPTQDIVLDDAIEAAPPVENPVTADDSQEATNAQPIEEKYRKEITATEDAFVSEIQAAMQDGIDRVVSKASTASRIRGAISRYGKSAYQDGLEDGGVDGSELDDDDLRLIADYSVWDSVYVTDLVDEIYSEKGMSETPETRAPKWVSTLNRFYYGGIASADKNGMYVFTGDDGKENCATCASLKGVKHRMKWWVDHELRPGIDHHMFDCGSWPGSCNHYLEKVMK